jgi:hypothetical protein
VRPQIAAILGAHCQYCGGQASGGCIDFLTPTTGVQRMWYMCAPCSREHDRYIQREFGLVSRKIRKLSQQEQSAALRELNIAADKHMKKWVLERDSQ